MMQGIAAFAMASRWRAILVATMTAVAALLVPPLTSPLGYIGAGVIGLVTLRLGALEGVGVLVAASAGLALLSAAGGGQALPAALGVAVTWLPLWALAMALRVTRSLALTLQLSALLGLVVVVVMHLALGQPADWWAPRLDEVLGPLLATEGLDAEAYLAELARWMTALIAAALVLGLLLSLLLARAWQAGLYNPGGFGSEFRALALGRGFALISLALAALTLLPGGALREIAADTLPTLAMVYLLQGLALAHAVAKQRNARRGWLIALYVLLFVAGPQVVSLVALVGWVDTWIDVRGRWPGQV